MWLDTCQGQEQARREVAATRRPHHSDPAAPTRWITLISQDFKANSEGTNRPAANHAALGSSRVPAEMAPRARRRRPEQGDLQAHPGKGRHGEGREQHRRRARAGATVGSTSGSGPGRSEPTDRCAEHGGRVVRVLAGPSNRAATPILHPVARASQPVAIPGQDSVKGHRTERDNHNQGQRRHVSAISTRFDQIRTPSRARGRTPTAQNLQIEQIIYNDIINY